MKKTNKLISLILALTMILSLFGAAIAFADPDTDTNTPPFFEVWFRINEGNPIEEGRTEPVDVVWGVTVTKPNMYIDTWSVNIEFSADQLTLVPNSVSGLSVNNVSAPGWQKKSETVYKFNGSLATANAIYNNSHNSGTQELGRMSFTLNPAAGLKSGDDVQLIFRADDGGESDTGVGMDYRNYMTGYPSEDIIYPTSQDTSFKIAPGPSTTPALDALNEAIEDGNAEEIKNILEDGPNRDELGLTVPDDFWTALNDADKDYIIDKLIEDAGPFTESDLKDFIENIIDTVLIPDKNDLLDEIDAIVTGASGNEADELAALLDGTDPETGINKGELLGIPSNKLSPEELEDLYDLIIAQGPYNGDLESLLELIQNFAKSNHVQFTIVPAPVDSGAVTPFSMGQMSAKELYAGQEYEMKVALSDLPNLTGLILPMVFDNSVIEITGVSKGAAFDSNWEPQISTYDMDEYLPYQVGTIKNDDYSAINTDGKFLFTIVYTGSGSKDILPIADPNAAADSELFFTIKFKVKDDATIGSDPGFKGAEQNSPESAQLESAWGPGYYFSYYTTANVDEWGLPVNDYSLLTVDITNPLVAEKELVVTIVDYNTQSAAALKSFRPIDESFEIDTVVVWNDGTVNPPISDTSVTWGADYGRVDIINDVPTYIPQAGYTGEVNITAVSKQDPSKNDIYAFNIIDLIITDPAEPTADLNMTTDPSMDIASQFIGGTLPLDDDAVSWTIKKDGQDIHIGNMLDDPISLTPKFTPAEPGVYELTITSEVYSELSYAIIVTVTKDYPVYLLKGIARLGSKSRSGNPIYGYAARNNYDEGIKVELVETATELAVAITYTNTTGHYEMKIDPDLDITGDGKFMLRFSRVGSNDDTVRNESYLYAELPLEVTTAIPAGTEIKISKVVALVAGSFISNNEKKTHVVQADVQAVKAFVGLIDSAVGYDEAVDINEYAGIEGGDLNIVRSSLGINKTLAKYKIN